MKFSDNFTEHFKKLPLFVTAKSKTLNYTVNHFHTEARRYFPSPNTSSVLLSTSHLPHPKSETSSTAVESRRDLGIIILRITCLRPSTKKLLQKPINVMETV